MSRINFILFWLGAFCIANLSFGQQTAMPQYCTNPGGGITVGGTFSVSPQIGCLDFTTTSATTYATSPLSQSGGTLTKLGYIFDFKDSSPLVFPPATSNPSITVSNPGIYWILQVGNNPSNIQEIVCQSFEVIKTDFPNIKVSSCGTNKITVTFLATDNNKNHSEYRIVWGDGTNDTFIQDVKPSLFPFDIAHDYVSTPTSKPQIEATYNRGGSFACRSTPYPFDIETNNKPKISELEGLTGGTSNKITMVEGADGTPYTLEQKPKNGNWADTGKKITRNTGETFKTETITGLNASTEYCYRLKTTDECNNDIVSNEVCTIIPKANVISSNEVKLDWNSPDPNVVRYSIGYSESPTGANPNNDAPSPLNATTYTFNALDCRKLYDFQITAILGTTPAERVVIKSPTILVNPATTPRLAPKTIGTVSVVNGNTIRFNIFEAGNKADNYIFYRSEGGSGNFSEVKQKTENFYDDQNVEPSKQQYCYKVEYQDKCGNTSEPSPAFCSVFLTSNRSNTLNWTQFVIPSDDTFPVDYYIEAIDANGNIQTVDVTTDNTLGVKAQIDILLDSPNSNGQAKFRIRGVQKVKLDIGGGTLIDFPFEVYSNEYIFITPAQLYVPTAFSPNSDGNNDTFAAKGRYIVEYNLEVYDRWGNVIFESKKLDDGWNGTTSDGVSPAPAGNYGFKIFGLDPAGQKFEKVGSVTLIR